MMDCWGNGTPCKLSPRVTIFEKSRQNILVVPFPYFTVQYYVPNTVLVQPNAGLKPANLY